MTRQLTPVSPVPVLVFAAPGVPGRRRFVAGTSHCFANLARSTVIIVIVVAAGTAAGAVGVSGRTRAQWTYKGGCCKSNEPTRDFKDFHL